MKLFIIIVSFDGGETLVKLISDLVEEKQKEKSMKLEIVVVDNGSEKKFKIQNSKFKIKIIDNSRNLGFAAGCNIGIKYALSEKADRILLLNQDVTIKPGFIKPLADNTADIVSPVIKFKRNDNWTYDFGGKVNWIIGRTKHMEKSSKFKVQSLKLNEEIDYVSGCAMLIKKEVFEKIGFFDERFFLYFEDVDFCTRVQEAGLQLTVEQQSVIVHNLIEGTQKSFSSQLELLKSNYKFINKYLGMNRFLGYLYLSVIFKKICLNKLFLRLS